MTSSSDIWLTDARRGHRLNRFEDVASEGHC
jgi:hypothetical protein